MNASSSHRFPRSFLPQPARCVPRETAGPASDARSDAVACPAGATMVACCGHAAARSAGSADIASAVVALLLCMLAVAAWLFAPQHASANGARVAASLHRVDLSRASAEELALLPGVGPRLAARIAVDRAVRGSFATVDDLARVPGFGAGTIEALRSAARVGDR